MERGFQCNFSRSNLDFHESPFREMKAEIDDQNGNYRFASAAKSESLSDFAALVSN